MKRPMTPRGIKLLRDQLKELKSMRPELAQAIDTARQHGDLSENADYDAAKNKSGMTEAKIRDIEGRLSSAEIINPLSIKSFETVVFGCTVKIEDVESGEHRTYSIYGSEETDLSKGWISYESPIARSLIAKQIGDIAEMHGPGGKRSFEILEIFVDYSEVE